MKRILFPLSLSLFICLGITVSANAQDSTKKADPVTQTPPKIKPFIHRHKKLYPIVNPTAPGQIHSDDSTSQTNDVKTPAAVPDQSNDKSLNGQYQYLINRTYNYQHPLISALWKSVTDTLNYQLNQILDLKAKLASKNKVVDSLKFEAHNKGQTVSESSVKGDTISMFGIVMSKTTYNLIMFGLVIGLGSAFFIVSSTTLKYKHDAKLHIELHEELEEKFKNYKAKANEKELKLARELQTERNKLDELLGRG